MATITHMRPASLSAAGLDSDAGLLLHLIRDHVRSPSELGAAPLTHVHRLEHLDDELGLLRLDHAHAS